MEKSEFASFMRNWKHFSLFVFTHNLDSGMNIYHACKYCPYHTKHITNSDSADLETIDNNAIEHVWKEHHYEAVKLALVYRSEAVASASGQKRLEI